MYLNVPSIGDCNFLTLKFRSLQRALEGSIQLQPTQLTRMWRLEEEEVEERGKAFPKSSFPWKKKKEKKESQSSGVSTDMAAEEQ